MASSVDFVVFAAEQLREAGRITYRKMFGEYALYCDGKVIGFVCDDQLFLKTTPLSLSRNPEIPLAPPYPGAHDYFLMDVEDRRALLALVETTFADLPEPKLKTRRSK